MKKPMLTASIALLATTGLDTASSGGPPLIRPSGSRDPRRSDNKYVPRRNTPKKLRKKPK